MTTKTFTASPALGVALVLLTTMSINASAAQAPVVATEAAVVVVTGSGGVLS